jgi:hypothetical protein
MNRFRRGLPFGASSLKNLARIALQLAESEL